MASVDQVEYSQSQTLEVQLDTDVESSLICEVGEKDVPSLLLFNEPPPSSSELLPELPDTLHINSLPRDGLQQLELYLNPPSRGSMLNWEYVAAEFGFPNNKITHMRTLPNPTSAVLQEISSCRLQHFLNVISELNRIDILVALQPYLYRLKNDFDNCRSTRSDSGAYVSSDGYDLQSAGSYSGLSTLSAASDGVRSIDQKSVCINCRFILVTHHEEETSTVLKRNFKWLMKNLRKQGQQVNMVVFNIDDYLQLEIGVHLDGLHSLFVNAVHILCVFSDDYANMLGTSDNRQNTTLKRYLHKLMDAEFVERLNDNQRFRAVILQGTERNVLPLGWAKSTLIYEFPAHHVQLFKKLFS